MKQGVGFPPLERLGRRHMGIMLVKLSYNSYICHIIIARQLERSCA